VKVWFEERGFGFIAPEGGGPDVYVHRSVLADGSTLKLDSLVAFKVQFDDTKNKYVAQECWGATGECQEPPVEPCSELLEFADRWRLDKGAVGVLARLHPDALAQVMDQFCPEEPESNDGDSVDAAKGGMDNLFVAGLPLAVTEDRIREIFSEHGEVTRCKVLSNKARAKSDTAALVWMASAEQAEAAISAMNQVVPDGMDTPLSVRYAESPAERDSRTKGHGKGKAKGKESNNSKAVVMLARSVQARLGNYSDDTPRRAPAAASRVTELPSGVIMAGRVKLWNEGKGYGFIVPDGGGPDVFVHRSVLRDGQRLETGLDVTFETEWETETWRYRATECLGALGDPPDPALGPRGVTKAYSGDIPDRPVEGAPESEVPTSRLHITSLHADVTEDTLRQLVAPHGHILSCKLSPHGSALVEMEDVEQAREVVDGLDRTVPDGMTEPLVIEYANQLGPSSRADPEEPSGSLFVAGLPKEATEAFIRQVFGDCGEIVSFKLVASRYKHDRSALVHMLDPDQAKRAIENLHDRMPRGATMPLTVRYAEKKAGKARSGAALRRGGAGMTDTPQSLGAAPSRGVRSQFIPAPPPPPSPSESASLNLFVAGLPLDADEVLIQEIIVQHGDVVSCRLLPDNGKRDRVALVQMADMEQARNTIKGLHQAHLEGFPKPLTVRYANTGVVDPSSNLFVAGLPAGSTESFIRELFGEFGEVTRYKVLPGGGDNERAALVQMGDLEQARRAIEALDQHVPAGFTIALTVRYADNRAEKAKEKAKEMTSRKRGRPSNDLPPLRSSRLPPLRSSRLQGALPGLPPAPGWGPQRPPPPSGGPPPPPPPGLPPFSTLEAASGSWGFAERSGSPEPPSGPPDWLQMPHRGPKPPLPAPPAGSSVLTPTAKVRPTSASAYKRQRFDVEEEVEVEEVWDAAEEQQAEVYDEQWAWEGGDVITGPTGSAHEAGGTASENGDLGPPAPGW